MKRRDLKNVAASVRQRLLNAARESGRPFDELLQYFAMERFLFRLSASPHGERFVLKGGLLLATWYAAPTRATRDIDLLGSVKGDPGPGPIPRAGRRSAPYRAGIQRSLGGAGSMVGRAEMMQACGMVVLGCVGVANTDPPWLANSVSYEPNWPLPRQPILPACRSRPNLHRKPPPRRSLSSAPSSSAGKGAPRPAATSGSTAFARNRA